MRPSQMLALALFAPSGLSQEADTREVEALKANFRLYSQYSYAAYCPSVTIGNDVGPVCGNKKPEECLDLANTTTFRKINSHLLDFEKYHISGYVAKDAVKKTIVVVFRGTMSARDLAVNLFFFMGDTKFGDEKKELCEDCQVHMGFRAAFSSVKTRVVDAVDALKRETGFDKVVVTGHSLGGAVATIASAYLRSKSYHCDLYTYGSPRVGNRQFARFVERQTNGANFRIVNQNDTVVAIPLEAPGRFPWLLRNRYDHIHPPYWYKGGLSTSGNPYGAKYEASPEVERSTCVRTWSLRPFKFCRITHHQVYANVNLQKETFKPCGDKQPRTGGDEAELTDDELKYLDKSLSDGLKQVAINKACARSCKSEEGQSCQPLSVKRLQDPAKCRCTVRLTVQPEAKVKDEDRDEIPCREAGGALGEGAEA